MIETRAVAGPVPVEASDDRTTFESLYRTQAKRIYSLAYRFAGNAAEAEELLQDIFLLAYRKLDSFRGEAALATWLHRLAVNRCLDHVRSRAARQAAATEALNAEGPPVREGSGPITHIDLEQHIGAAAPIPAGAREVLTRNLAIVDDAIAESRSAVAADPSAAIARERLRAGLAQKLTLLRTMAALELEGG